MIRAVSKLTIAAALVAVTSGGAQPSDPLPATPKTDASLIVLPGAEGVGVSEPNTIGEIRLWYTLQAPFPASGVTDAVKHRLSDLGFSERSESFVDPGRPFHGQFWDAFGDLTTGSPLCVRRWWGEWEDDEGRVVAYILRYHSAGSHPGCNTAPDNNGLRVLAILAPPSAVQWHRDAVRALEDRMRRESILDFLDQSRN